MNPSSIVAMADGITEALRAQENPEDAVHMAAYMKTDMPFFGVRKPGCDAIFKTFMRENTVADVETYHALVSNLWARPRREEKHLAILVARGVKAFIKVEQLPLYEKMIREGAWWDFVDVIAKHLVGKLQRENPAILEPIMHVWVEDDDMWIRRSAILSQLGYKGDTNEDMLFSFALQLAPETEFFIRKAVGWAIRDYSYAAPDSVAEFMKENKSEFSGLTYREATRILKKHGWDL